MRVTSEMMVTGSLRRLQSRLAKYETAQKQLSTGRLVNVPSDDPSQASRALVLRAALQSREQELRAATDATAIVNRADSELQSANDVLRRIRDLTVAASNEVSTDERAAIAQEVSELREQLVSIANTKHGGRALFAGFQNSDAVAKVAGAWAYRGDQGAVIRRVSDTDRVQVNVLAEDVFGFSSGTDTFTALDDLETALRTDDRAGIQSGLDAVDTAISHVNDGLATLGAAANRVDSAKQRTEGAQLDLRTELSDVEDIDVAEGIMNLQVQETAYQATLQALGRSLPDTLVSFLR
jgi:flagellar hook-associated protein 3 FlgL